MGTLFAKDILTRASTIVNDTTSVRWPESELLNWLNDAQREIVNQRPDSNAVNVSHPLIAGTKQTIPAGGIRLLDVTRNLGAAALPIVGNAIRLIDREVLDAQMPNWHVIVSNSIQHYIFDERDPKNFYVYPQAAGTEAIEIIYSASPTDVIPAGGAGTILAGTEAITVDDIYANPMLDFILSRSYMKDSDYAGNASRASLHYQSFSNSLGIKGQFDVKQDPNNNAAPFNRAVQPQG